MVAKFLDLNKPLLCKYGRKTQKFDMHDFPGMIALRNKTVAHTFLQSFDHAGGWLSLSVLPKFLLTAGKTEHMHHKSVRFRRLAASGVREMAPLLLGNLGAKFSEILFPKYKTCFTQIGRYYLKF